MTIKQQLSLLTVSTVAVAVIVTAALTILLVLRQGKSTLTEYREEEMRRIQTNIREYVEMAYQSIESNYRLVEDNAYLQKFYGHRLQNIIDIAVAAIEKRAQQARENKISLNEAKRLAIEDIEAMRFDDNTGYIWINDTTLPYPKMIMHPTVPDLNGTYLDDPKFDCAMGRNQNLFQAATEVALANGSGFIDYIWPKPTPSGVSEPVKKLSFVYHVKEWEWVLGTGIYLDDAHEDIINNIIEQLHTMKYNEGQGYFWITDATLPYPTMVMHPTVPSLNGTVLNDTSFNCVKGTNQNFFQLMVEKTAEGQGAYVEYIWPNPVTNQRESKLSYVRRFEPLNWVVGTGSFIDHIETQIQAKEAEITSRVRSMVWITIGISIVLIAGAYWASSSRATAIARAIITVKDSLQKLSKGKSIDTLEVKGNNEISVMNASLNELVNGINTYSNFANEIGTGNLDNAFKPLSEEDALGNALVQMRDNLKAIREEEQQRKWHAEGLALFNDLIRKHSEKLDDLCHHVTIQIAKYTNMNQAALYTLEGEDDDDDRYLELQACYAYDRHRYGEKRISIMEGLIGQAALEKGYIYLTDVPEDYISISSGLGYAKPSVVIIYPLIYQENVYGVLEMASFRKLRPFEIDFLGKFTEALAASISTSRTAEQTRQLLEESRQMAEEMKAQEEELRQNNEELMATQEEMVRRMKEDSESSS